MWKKIVDEYKITSKCRKDEYKNMYYHKDDFGGVFKLHSMIKTLYPSNKVVFPKKWELSEYQIQVSCATLSQMEQALLSSSNG